MISEKIQKWIPEKFGGLVRYGQFEEYGEEIPVEVYKERVQRAKERLSEEGLDALVVWADSYRMSNVRWLVNYRTIDGIYPQTMLVYLTADRDPVLFLPPSHIGSAHTHSMIDAMGGDVREVRSELAPFLKERVQQDNPRRIGISGFDFMDLEIYLPVAKAFSEAEVKKVDIIERLKSKKTEAELNSMRRGGRASAAGIQMLMDLLRDGEGITEKEATSLVYAAMFANGAHSIAYDIMIQAGENTENLFTLPTDRPIRRGDLVMMDYGCRINWYASDNARTIAYGNVTAEQRHLMEACTRGHEEGLKHIKAGMTAKESDEVIRQVYRDEGVEEYLVAPSAGRNGVHATGMDPEEEIPGMGPGIDEVYEAGQTFAYELSLIKPGVGGVRTEDPVVVREDGLEPLHDFPHYLYVE